ncbi:cyanuric acid amidohydrolase [Xanthobacter flavus]|uniref:Cyanuric acid amidohydrolase n=1 Tax=Xanthobacter flavus TaxID=281 RepID=A0A9W6FL84_XANFL|nr:ring-opening amidohydrolase [Xanthobacter flavus]MDR6336587.1 cyanuric acid amidohydrolase [Xanthobacter flavus]GLI24554.1 cyanuric acid amidohydrolase [Xanthobacter flavus]
MPTAKVHRIPTASPDDVSGLAAAIASGAIAPEGILAIFGKTEGNGCVNDFSRGFAVAALQALLRSHLGDAADEVCLVMSGGTEGGMSPHLLVFEVAEADANGASPALAVGRAHTPDLPSEHLGRMGQVRSVAEGVRRAMEAAGITDAVDVHFVQVKCPLLTAARVREAEARGATTATSDTLKSMGLSRGASALGIALALGEIAEDALSDAAICADYGLWSGRASCSSGIELLGHEIVVLGMSKSWSGPLAIAHAVMADAIDVAPVREAIGKLGGAPGEDTIVLAKAEASRSGLIRGKRHTMLDDSDISSTRHARAFVAGALAGVVGHTEIYVSGGAEHQGPDGGGPVAVILQSLADCARVSLPE